MLKNSQKEVHEIFERNGKHKVVSNENLKLINHAIKSNRIL